jgi:hypothetical protein
MIDELTSAPARAVLTDGAVEGRRSCVDGGSCVRGSYGVRLRCRRYCCGERRVSP